jgi:phosphoribosylformimino-5-aminoimidazole carboxamide ribotide isomerase
MIVVPAVDVRGGKAVRLVRGDPTRETVYDEDPVAAARRWIEAGASLLHAVDLDAALGTGSNQEVIAAICAAADVRVQAGGGLRSPELVRETLHAGAARAVIGTQAALDPAFVSECVRIAGDRIVVALDAAGDRVMVRGWQDAGPTLDVAIEELEGAGAPRFLVTSIAMDGTLEGPDLALYERVCRLTDRPVQAGGGVRNADDVRALADLGLEAVVVGKALYEGTLRLDEVIHV